MINFIKKLFGIEKSTEKEEQKPIDPAKIKEFFELLEDYKKEAILLQPRKSEKEISWKESKFGGVANLESFSEYPLCDCCQSSLNFVFQIYKKDLPEFYFPGTYNIFQLFRCPNKKCSEARKGDLYDQKMFHYFSEVKCITNKTLEKRAILSGNIEKEVPDCMIQPKKITDFPGFLELWDNNKFVEIRENFVIPFNLDSVCDQLSVPGTKVFGYPDYVQGFPYPICNCSKTKEFLFQLSSKEENTGHGILIGDAGNIYWYFCKDCGEKSIESNRDCG